MYPLKRWYSCPPAVWRFSDSDVASLYLEKSINGIRNVESDFTSYSKACSILYRKFHNRRPAHSHLRKRG